MENRANRKQFGQMLTKAIRTIATYEEKNISVIQDEIGYSLRKKNGEYYKGGTIIEYWRKGHLPPDRDTILELAKVLAERHGLDEKKYEKFLLAAGERGPEDFYQALFSPTGVESKGETSETSISSSLTAQKVETEKTFSINISWNSKTMYFAVATIFLVLAAAYAYFRPRNVIPTPQSGPSEAYVLSAVHTDQAPEIDGRLDDQVWMKATHLVFAKHPPQNGMTTATIKLLWDNYYLYAGFDINDTQVEGSSVTPWDGDSVSLILDSEHVENEPETVEYRHSLLGQANADTRGDFLSRHYLKDHTTYNEPKNDDVGYSVEMRIPWITLPTVGTLVKVDLLSVDHDNNPDTEFDDPDTVFSKVFWDNDSTVDKSEGYLLLEDN